MLLLSIVIHILVQSGVLWDPRTVVWPFGMVPGLICEALCLL